MPGADDRLLASAVCFCFDSMLLLLLRLFARLPLRVLHALGRFFGRLIYMLPGRYRTRLQANATQAGYDDPAFWRRAAAETGAMIFETPKVWLHEAACLRVSTVANLDVYEQARATGRGILFLTPHLGCFEVSARTMALHQPMTVMFREPRSALLRPVMEVARSNSVLRAVPATTRGVRDFVRTLRRGEAIGMLPDQVPGQGEGVWADVFGRPAYTVTLPGRLAQQTGVVILMAACERLPKGAGWRIHFERVPDPLPTDPKEQADLINAAMEKLIRRFPEQYLWSYHRYKVPKGARAVPPDDTGAHAGGTPAEALRDHHDHDHHRQ